MGPAAQVAQAASATPVYLSMVEVNETEGTRQTIYYFTPTTSASTEVVYRRVHSTGDIPMQPYYQGGYRPASPPPRVVVASPLLLQKEEEYEQSGSCCLQLSDGIAAVGNRVADFAREVSANAGRLATRVNARWEQERHRLAPVIQAYGQMRY